MQANYHSFIDRMITVYEGNYGWDPGDPGGPTKYGITCYDLAEFEGRRMNSMSAWAPLVRAMPLATAETIYANKYATACDFNNLGTGADCAVLDFGVNSGPSRAVKYAQIIVGVPVDGIIGPITQKAINNFNPSDFVVQLCRKRMRFLQGLGSWRTFGTGWTNRVNDLQDYCLNLIHQEPMAAIVLTNSYVAKSSRIDLAFGKGWSEEPATQTA